MHVFALHAQKKNILLILCNMFYEFFIRVNIKLILKELTFQNGTQSRIFYKIKKKNCPTNKKYYMLSQNNYM